MTKEKDIYVFLDFEFACVRRGEAHKREIISMAAVFMNAHGEVLHCFESIVQPTKYKEINDVTVRLIGLSKEDILNAPTFDIVVEDFLELVERYKPKKYFIWGDADYVEVKRSANYANALTEICDIAEEFINLQNEFKQNLKLKYTLNLEKMANIYGFEFKHTFSALEDAMCLGKIYFLYKNKKPNREKIELYESNIKSKDVVNTYEFKINYLKTLKKSRKKLKARRVSIDKETEEYTKIMNKINIKTNKISKTKRFIEKNFPKYDKAKEILLTKDIS